LLSVHILLADILENHKQLSGSDTPLARRNYVRSVFALFDYRLFALRDATIKLILAQHPPYDEATAARIVPLLEQYPRLRENGRVETELNRNGFLSLLAYTLKQYSGLTGYTKDVLSDHRFTDFRSALALRNRITHPRPGESMDISDDDLASVEKAMRWWDAVMKEIGWEETGE